ncbi:hypothetical protein [Nocardia paucivorans]|uniref:hypothetical protein n=1 Tax=Nocardia paucivorans TaxID=114259 RepID=UPI0002F026C1|nr:hypothetical protein [Nocardia paucivorans]
MFALICVLLSAAGHSLTSAHTISLSTLVLATGFLTALAWSVADREQGLTAITVGLLAGQGALHLWFTADVSGGHADHAAMAHRLADTGTPAMLGAHGLAALLCALWLRRGERTAFALAATLYARIVLPLLLLVPPLPAVRTPVVTRPSTDHDNPVTTEFLLHAMVRRGPPHRIASYLPSVATAVTGRGVRAFPGRRAVG